MRRIKIVKKKAVTGEIRSQQTVSMNFDHNSRLGDTVQRWIADWRTRKEIEKRSALNELNRLKKTDATRLTN